MADVAKIKSLLDQAEVSIRQRPNRPPPDVVTAVATLIAAIRELLVTEKPALKAALPPDINKLHRLDRNAEAQGNEAHNANEAVVIAGKPAL